MSEQGSALRGDQRRARLITLWLPLLVDVLLALAMVFAVIGHSAVVAIACGVSLAVFVGFALPYVRRREKA
jgi:hypothetical protein